MSRTDNESFIREIDEELKKNRQKALFKNTIRQIIEKVIPKGKKTPEHE